MSRNNSKKGGLEIRKAKKKMIRYQGDALVRHSNGPKAGDQIRSRIEDGALSGRLLIAEHQAVGPPERKFGRPCEEQKA